MALMARVLAYLHCYNRITYTGWFINSQNLFLTVLKAKKSKIKGLADLVSSKGLLPGS